MTQPIPQGYKQTEIGVIPEDWEVCSIGDKLKIRHGKSQKSIEVEGGLYPILATGGQIGTTNTALYRKPSILIGRKGTIDRPQFIDTPFWTVDTLFYSELCDEVDGKFLYNKFCMVDWRSYNEASGVPSLNASTIENVLISIPTRKPEQTAIATALSDVDALISGLESLIAKKQAIKTATMQQLLTGKTRLPQFAHHPDGTAKGYKQTELGLIPEDWGVRNLGDLLEYEQPTKYLVSHAKFLNEGSYPVLTAGKSFVLGYTNETNGIFTDLPVIIFDDFTTDSKFVNFPFKAKSSAMKMLKPRNKKTPLSLIYNLLNSVDYLVGDHKRHWIGEFQFLNVAMPSDYEEQTAIAQILSDMDEEIQALETRLNKTKQIKHGMMQVLLTGKVRLV